MLEDKINKQIAVSLKCIDWFILHGFLKSIVEDPGIVKILFKTKEDSEVVEKILTDIQRQFAPLIITNVEDIIQI